jgi:glycosyltransferase involved in cell wall biosynthesis
MPFLDVAPYLAQAIESVRSQTYPDWELLLIDDGSTDGSTDIAQRFAALDPGRIRWVEHDGHANLGASASRNVGLRLSSGEYFAMLDGDDVWLPRKLDEQVALLSSFREVDVLCGSTEYWYSWAGDAPALRPDLVVLPGLPEGSLLRPPEFLILLLQERIPVPCTCDVIVRLDAVRRVGGFEETFTHVFTDQAFYAKLFLNTTVLITQACWSRYRRHQASSVETVKRAGNLPAARLRYLTWVDTLLDVRGVRDVRLRRALRAALWRTRYPRLWRIARRFGHAFTRG